MYVLKIINSKLVEINRPRWLKPTYTGTLAAGAQAAAKGAATQENCI